MSDVSINTEAYFAAVGELRGPSHTTAPSLEASSGTHEVQPPDVSHAGANEALATMVVFAKTLGVAIRAQRDVMANEFTVIGLDAIAADGVVITEGGD